MLAKREHTSAVPESRLRAILEAELEESRDRHGSAAGKKAGEYLIEWGDQAHGHPPYGGYTPSRGHPRRHNLGPVPVRIAEQPITNACCQQNARADETRNSMGNPILIKMSTGKTVSDVVLLQSGDRVPADLRLLHVRNLHVDESALTGESFPVGRYSDPLRLDTLLAERKNLAYAGTLL